MTDVLLDVEDVAFSYGRLQVLFGISLTVHADEALALVGTNGAGKSTLLRVCAGLDAPDTGTIVFDGEDVSHLPAERLVERGLVLVRGGKGVFSDMTVEENLDVQVTTLRKRPGWVDQRKAFVYETFPRLAERRSQAAGSLSGGEQQQLALAKGLMLEPKLLCIDELSLGLAPVLVAELLDIVRQTHAAGTGIVLVEQSLNIAAQVCPRAVFLEKGEVRFEGRTSELIDRADIARAVFLGAS